MAGYAKMWYQFMTDKWVQSLNCLHRGIFFQLYLLCKEGDGLGHFSVSSWATLAHTLGCDRSVLVRFVSKNQREVSAERTDSLTILVVHYEYWQRLTAKDASTAFRPLDPTIREDYIRKDNTTEKVAVAPPKKKAKKEKKKDTRPPLERFESYLKTDFTKIIDIGRIYKQDCSDQYLVAWIKAETKTMRAWIIANPDKVKGRTGWGQMISTWLRKAANSRPDTGGGMTYDQEREHFANKSRSGESSDFQSVSEILNKHKSEVK